MPYYFFHILLALPFFFLCELSLQDMHLKKFIWLCWVLLRSFNGPEPSGPESTNKKVKEKEADILWFMQKANKAPGTGLALFMEASGALLMG